MKTVAQQVKELLEPVTKEEFVENDFTNGITKKCCVLGHVMRLTSEDPGNYNFYGNKREDIPGNLAAKLRVESARFMLEKHRLHYYSIVDVNNRRSVNGYDEPEIKDRVMHVLNDMIEAGY